MLPIQEVEVQIVDALRRATRLVLTAPTGSGKTTRVPEILLRSGVVDGQILVLQPRRLPTRLVAAHVAARLGVPLGNLVGYETRHDRRVSAATRIRFMTEGMFLRRTLADATLAGVGAVVLDEFHERSVAADTALGLVLRLQAERPALHLLVMSATLQADALAAHLGCPLITASGRAHPIHLAHVPRRSERPCWQTAAEALRGLLDAGASGDVLVFMPGAYEIQRTIEACRSLRRPADPPLLFCPLHGGLSPARQDAAVAPGQVRKVIVATNVAETSITIDSVRHVIDSGLARVHRFDPRRGLNVLLTEPISQASADQRAGRAGRTAPGTCTRLWPAHEHRARPAAADPEVLRVDLAETVLYLMGLGGVDLEGFPWLCPPPADALARALDVLAMLGALDADGALTPVGRALARFPLHPRLGRMLLAAGEHACVGRAALWAALIGERDILARPLHPRQRQPVVDDIPSDLVVRERAFRDAARRRFEPQACAEFGVLAGAARDVELARRSHRAVCRRLGLGAGDGGDTEAVIKCLLVAFPDHVALRRDGPELTCALPGHRRVMLDRHSAAREARLLLAVEVRETEAAGGVRTVLGLASPLQPAWLEQVHAERITVREQPAWNAQRRGVQLVRQTCFGMSLEACSDGPPGGRLDRPSDELVYDERWHDLPDPAVAAPLLVERVLDREIRLRRWDEQVAQWIERTRSVGRWCPERGLIAYDDDDLGVVLLEIVAGATRAGQVVDRPCLPAVRNALSWSDQQFVERMAPDRIRLPGGHRMKITYAAEGPPRGRARIADLVGLEATPRIAGGRQPLGRFWSDLYPRVRAELKRRYPRHPWP